MGALTKKPDKRRANRNKKQGPIRTNNPGRMIEDTARVTQQLGKESMQDSANMNRVNEQGIFGGSQEWSQDPNTGKWTRKTSMGDTSQQMVNAEDQYSLQMRQAGQRAGNQAARSYSQPYSYNGISEVMGGQQLGDARNQAASSAYEAQMGLMRPEREQQNQQFEQMAASRGWVPGSKVYEKEKNRLQNQQASQDRSLALESYNTGLNEYNTMFNTSTSDRQRQIQEMNNMRDRPMQEAQAMMGAGPGARQESFTDYGPVENQSQEYFKTGLAAPMQYQNQQWQGQQNAMDRNAQLRAAGIARGSQGENLTMAQQMELTRQQMLWEQQNGFRPSYNDSGDSGSSWGGVAAGVGAGIGQGLGQGFANLWKK